MNELHNLGPNTAHLNQKPQNPFSPGDRVVKKGDDDASVAVVIEVLLPENNVNVYGQTMDGEAVSVAFPDMLDAGPANWREIHPAKLASYCDDQDIRLYTYKHTNLESAANPFTLGDYVIKPDYHDPDLAVVLEVSEEGGNHDEVCIAFVDHLKEHLGEDPYLLPSELTDYCDEMDIKSYTYEHGDLSFEHQY